MFEAGGMRQDRIHVTLGFTQVTDVCRPNRWVRFLELSEILQTYKTDDIKHELNYNNFVKIKLQAKCKPVKNDKYINFENTIIDKD